MIEKILFDKETYIWKTKLDFSSNKTELLNEAKQIIDNSEITDYDAYTHFSITKDEKNLKKIIENNYLNKTLKLGINWCSKILETDYNIEYDSIIYDSWINVVRAKKPKQFMFKDKNKKFYHNHVELTPKYKPFFTFVYYIQMPNNLQNDDGKLYVKRNSEYSILPEEDDLIIMEGNLPHSPMVALNSDFDRIVLACNISFETDGKLENKNLI